MTFELLIFFYLALKYIVLEVFPNNNAQYA